MVFFLIRNPGNSRRAVVRLECVVTWYKDGGGHIYFHPLIRVKPMMIQSSSSSCSSSSDNFCIRKATWKQIKEEGKWDDREDGKEEQSGEFKTPVWVNVVHGEKKCKADFCRQHGQLKEIKQD